MGYVICYQEMLLWVPPKELYFLVFLFGANLPEKRQIYKGELGRIFAQ